MPIYLGKKIGDTIRYYYQYITTNKLKRSRRYYWEYKNNKQEAIAKRRVQQLTSGWFKKLVKIKTYFLRHTAEKMPLQKLDISVSRLPKKRAQRKQKLTPKPQPCPIIELDCTINFHEWMW